MTKLTLVLIGMLRSPTSTSGSYVQAGYFLHPEVQGEASVFLKKSLYTVVPATKRWEKSGYTMQVLCIHISVSF